MFSNDIEDTARRVIQTAGRAGLWLSTAESCTGGLVGAALTAIPGASTVYDRGFITYSNSAKIALLGVPEATLAAHGAVSGPVARAMAQGARRAAGANLAVAVTGIAGPGGGSAEKPVGLVHFGLALPDGSLRHQEMRFGDLGREAVRQMALKTALNLLEDALVQSA